VAALDKDLLEGVNFNTLLIKYSGKFNDETKPLNRTVLYTHRKHLRRSIPVALLQIPDIGNHVLNKETTEVTTPERSSGFDTYLGTVKKDQELVDVLVNSAMEDLLHSDEMLAAARGAQDQSLVLSVRNQVRKCVGEFITLNSKMSTPELGMAIGDTNKKLFIEFLLIVKKSAEAAIPDEGVRDKFLLEITSQLRKSREFKYVLEEERDRRDIGDKLSAEALG
jgi:hypothetical protein